jgi:hypothetical protein
LQHCHQMHTCNFSQLYSLLFLSRRCTCRSAEQSRGVSTSQYTSSLRCSLTGPSPVEPFSSKLPVKRADPVIVSKDRSNIITPTIRHQEGRFARTSGGPGVEEQYPYGSRLPRATQLLLCHRGSRSIDQTSYGRVDQPVSAMCTEDLPVGGGRTSVVPGETF